MILLIILLCGCGNGDGDGTTPPPTLTSISVAPVDSYIAKGTNLQFTATGRYSDGHTRIITSQVSWTSTDAAVAVVNGTGLVSAGLTSGVTQIVATLENVSGSTTLNVVSVSSISVSPAASIAPGTRIQYTATGTLTGSATTQDLTSYAAWTSSDVTVAEISSEGLATGKAVGLTNIRAIFQSTVGTEVLTVSEVVSIALTPSVANIPLGTSQTFAAVGTLTDGASQVLTLYSDWSSLDTSVATVPSRGLATSVGIGSTFITATYRGINGSASLQVNAAELVAVSVEPSSVTAAPGDEIHFSATGTYTDLSTFDITDMVSWDSSHTEVAIISNTGVATAVSDGSTEISATLNSVSGSASLMVSAEAQSHMIYVTNTASNTVSVIDASSHAVLSHIPVGSEPTGIALDRVSKRAYVANTGDGTVTVIDTSTNKIVGSAIRVGSSPGGIAISSTIKKVYVTNFLDNTVSVISMANDSVVQTIQLGPGTRPRGVATDVFRNRAYVTNSGNATVTVIDTGSDTVIGFPIPVGGIPIGITADSSSQRVYTANSGNGTVSIIDTANVPPVVVASVPLGLIVPWGVSVYPAEGLLYVTSSGSGTVAVMDTILLQLAATIDVGMAPKGISIDTTSGIAYVANSVSNTVSVIDTARNRVVADVAVGLNPEGVASQ